MPDDFGDDSGQRMIDEFTRFAERMGEESMRLRAMGFKRACEHASRTTQEKGAPWEEPTEWAKLDMGEFQQLEDYEGLKEIIGAKIDARGADHAWFPDGRTGREYLLFRIRDAREVWRSFDELARESDSACERASENAKREVERRREDPDRAPDDRPLDERADQARKASAALEREGSRQAREPLRVPRRNKERTR